MASSSSSSYFTSQCIHEVFISFRGEDTRDNFTSHLSSALSKKQIKIFIDEKSKRGGEIWPEILKAIIGSRISVVIFSQDYASSEWCLNELVEILECKKSNGQIVIPIFYHVHPSDVRKQTGNFGKAFVQHEFFFKKMPEKVSKWRDVLREASYLTGHESVKFRTAAILVDVVVNDILKHLEHISVSTDSKGLIGISSRIEHIKSLRDLEVSNCPNIVGIWGMGGIGKTTIAKALFNQISCEFEGKCFVSDVKEKSKKVGLEHLEKQILSQLLEENIKREGLNIPPYIKQRLQRMKVLLVLDDVNKAEQLKDLVGEFDRFGPGSRIIVTTRDRSVLDIFRVKNMYEVEKMNGNESLELFSNYAFRNNHPPQDLVEPSKRVLDYVDGNPLALQVLGCFFSKKSKKQDWDNALDNLKRISRRDIYDVLRISYDELDWDEKNLFLDIACFFKRVDKDHVKLILDDSYSVDYLLDILIDKSLIRISNNILDMHDLLQEMGRKIVVEESINEPGKRSRLWNHEDIYRVLKQNEGTGSIQGIFLDMSKIRDLRLASDAFAKMSNLRLLKFYLPYDSVDRNMSSKVHLRQGLNYLPDSLIYLHWHGYPLKMLPSKFDPEKLVVLNLPYSEVKRLWKGKKEAFKLKSIDLHHSKYFTTFPDPSKTPNLKRINFDGTNLTSIPSYTQNFGNLSILSLRGRKSQIQNFGNLSILSLRKCKSLRCFSSNIHFSAPIKIDCSFCDNLTEFPKISGSVRELNLSYTAVKDVPSSIQRLLILEKLDLTLCRRLKSISSSICKLKSLCRLDLKFCSNLESFPEIEERMERLEHISLCQAAIRELPSSIERVEGLKELWLTDCPQLDSLPESLRNLKSLNSVHARCRGFRGLVKNRGFALPSLPGSSSIKKLDLRNCDMEELPQDIGCVTSLEDLNLSENNFKTLPTSIKQLSRLGRLKLRKCKMLQSLPELPLRLSYLNASYCEQLENLPDLPSCLEELDASLLETWSQRSKSKRRSYKAKFKFNNCLELNKKANMADSQERMQRMIISTLTNFYDYKESPEHCESTIYLPGSAAIPEWFSNQVFNSKINFCLSQHQCNRNFLGFAFCAVVELNQDCCPISFVDKIEYRCIFKTNSPSKKDDDPNYCIFDGRFPLGIESDRLILGFVFNGNGMVPDGDHLTTVSFRFHLYGGEKVYRDCMRVKCCGVCPVYAHRSKTKSNTYSLKFGDSSEEE